jgi:23S rRNA (uracil1939-C5)-methyltransferase
VKEGEEINAVIEAIAEKGDGIAKKAGFVIFVPGTKVGDKVKIRVKKVAKKVAFAEVVGSYEEGASAPAQESAPAEQAAEEQPAEENYDASQDSEEF